MGVISDPISDFLIRLKNASRAKNAEFTSPSSKMRVELARILKEEGYIWNYEVDTSGQFPQLKVTTKFVDGVPALTDLKRISRPGRRNYVGSQEVLDPRLSVKMSAANCLLRFGNPQDERNRKMSRVGNKAIALPEKVKFAKQGSQITVEGPKGKLEWSIPEGIILEEGEGNLTISRENDKREQRAMHGTTRSLIQNMILGVSEGVGLRAALKGSILDLSLGKSHPILHPIPEGLTVTVTENTKIKVEGIDKQCVGQFAAEVRAYYPPEPYKGNVKLVRA